MKTETLEAIKGFQRSEITEHHIYKKLAAREKGKNKKTLLHISADELKHYNIWKKISKKNVKPDKFKISIYSLLSRIAGITFAMKLMEKRETVAYKTVSKKEIPFIGKMIADENRHEKDLVAMIDEEKLNYIGSMVLGLNDALVELTGAIAGLTFALQKTSIVGIAGLITGIAAALSMAVSEYLSKKSEKDDKSPLKASVYTGIAYIITVALLVFPFFVFSNIYLSLGITLVNALIIIFVFTFFVSVTKEEKFRRKFTEMVLLSFGVAAISFLIGLGLRYWIGIDI